MKNIQQSNDVLANLLSMFMVFAITGELEFSVHIGNKTLIAFGSNASNSKFALCIIKKNFDNMVYSSSASFLIKAICFSLALILLNFF